MSCCHNYNKTNEIPLIITISVMVVTVATAILWIQACEKGEWEEPEHKQDIDLNVVIEPEGGFDCGKLAPLDGEIIPVWEMICDNHIFKARVECYDYAVWPISSLEKLNSDLQVDFQEDECNVDFEKEMVLALCDHLPCSLPFERCDSKMLPKINIFRFLQQYSCNNGHEYEPEFFNYYFVVPKTSRNIGIELHRYYWDK